MPPRGRGNGLMQDGSELTPEEVAFGQALHAWKRRRQVAVPGPADILDVLHGLGYERPGGPLSTNELTNLLILHKQRLRVLFLPFSEVLGILVRAGYALPGNDLQSCQVADRIVAEKR